MNKQQAACGHNGDFILFVYGNIEDVNSILRATMEPALRISTDKRYFDDDALEMADRTGLEPATSGVTGRHSNQLNYRSVE